MRQFILQRLSAIENGYSVCGIVDRRGRVYPLGSDTKVISSIFEIITRQAVATYASSEGLILKEPERQNHYPDFTLMRGESDRNKIAIDVKTTYKKTRTSKFGYTLGSYTSYIHPQTESKNIVYPYSEYGQHWIVGFVYRRTESKRVADCRVYSFAELEAIKLPIEDVEVFMQEKWRIAGDRAGSGNTTNIGSIVGSIEDFELGRGVFKTESEFLDYWRGYKRTGRERKSAYSTIGEFRGRYAG